MESTSRGKVNLNEYAWDELQKNIIMNIHTKGKITMKDIITLKINCTNFIDVKSDDLTVVQIQFDGSASGEYFNGKVMPGGVDTQKIYPDGTGKLSARYTLEGTDCEGNECRIFIENEADLGSSVTRPSVLTDSAALSWMNNSEFVGELINDDSGLRITIRLAEK